MVVELVVTEDVVVIVIQIVKETRVSIIQVVTVQHVNIIVQDVRDNVLAHVLAHVEVVLIL